MERCLRGNDEGEYFKVMCLHKVKWESGGERVTFLTTHSFSSDLLTVASTDGVITKRTTPFSSGTAQSIWGSGPARSQNGRLRTCGCSKGCISVGGWGRRLRNHFCDGYEDSLYWRESVYSSVDLV